MPSADHEQADGLSAYLDARPPGARPRDLDPTTIDAVQRFYASDDAPPPPHDLTRQLWEDLMNQTPATPFPRTLPLTPRLGVPPSRNGRRPTAGSRLGPAIGGAEPSLRRPALTRGAALALLLLTLALGYAVFGPIRPDPDRPLSVPAVLAPATPESAEATPTTDSLAAYPSFTAELAAGADLPDDLEAPVMLSMIRLTLDPGATYPLLAVDPTTSLLLVESGTFTVTLEAPASVRRAAGAGTPFPEVVEELAAGTEFAMAPGDSALFPAHTVGEFSNDGTEPAVALVALLLPASAVNG